MSMIDSLGKQGRYQFVKKTMTIVIALSFLLPTLTFAFQPATYPADPVGAFGHTPFKVNGHTIQISPKYGMITSSFQGHNKKTVIYIQDLHCHYEVQNNIYHIIKGLAQRNNLALVGVEGESRPVDVGILSSIADQEVRKEVSDYFIKRGRLTGPEYTAAIGDHAITLTGIETQKLYDYSKDKVLEFLTDQNQGYVEDLRFTLNKLKRPLYTTELAKMDHQKERFNYDELSLESYCTYLLGEAGRLGVSYQQYGYLKKFAKDHRMPTQGVVDYENLMQDAYLLEQKLRDKLYTNQDQRRLDHFINLVRIMESMININALEQDLHYFRAQRDQFSIPNIVEFIDQVGYRYAVDPALDPGVIRLEKALEKAQAFYLAADKRSSAFIKNLLTQMDRREQNLAVLITGGFHAAQVEKSMRAKGLNYVAVKPRITRTDVPNPYYNILKGRLTPIEKLIKQHEKLLAPASVLHSALYQRYINMVKQIVAGRRAAGQGRLNFRAETFQLKPELSNPTAGVYVGQFANDPELMVVIRPNDATDYPLMVAAEELDDQTQLQFVHREVWEKENYRAAILGSTELAQQSTAGAEASQTLRDLFDLTRYVAPLTASQGWLGRLNALWTTTRDRGWSAWTGVRLFLADRMIAMRSFNFDTPMVRTAGVFLAVMAGGALLGYLGLDSMAAFMNADASDYFVPVLDAMGLTQGPQVANVSNQLVPNGIYFLGVASITVIAGFSNAVIFSDQVRAFLGLSPRLDRNVLESPNLVFPNRDDLIAAANRFAYEQLGYGQSGYRGELGFIESLKTIMTLSETNQALQSYISNRADRLALAGMAYQNGRLSFTEDLPTGRVLSFAQDFIAGEELAQAVLDDQPLSDLPLGNSHLAQLITEIQNAQSEGRQPVFQLGYKDGLAPERLLSSYFTNRQLEAINKLVAEYSVKLTWMGLGLNPILGLRVEPEQARALLAQQLDLARRGAATAINLPLEGNRYAGLTKTMTRLASSLNLDLITSEEPVTAPVIWSENVPPAMRELITGLTITRPGQLNSYLTQVMRQVAFKDGRELESEIEITGLKKAEYVASGAVKRTYRVVVATNIGDIAVALRFIQQPEAGELYEGKVVNDYIPFIGNEVFMFKQIADATNRPRLVKAVFDRSSVIESFDDQSVRTGMLDHFINEGLDGVEVGLFHDGVTLEQVADQQRVQVFRENVALMAATWKQMQKKVNKKMRGLTVNDMKPQNFVFNADPQLNRVDYIDLDKTTYTTANRFIQSLNNYFDGGNSEYSIWPHVQTLGDREDLYSQIILGGLLDGWGAEEFMRRMNNYALQQVKVNQRPAFYQQVREFIQVENNRDLIGAALAYQNFLPQETRTALLEADRQLDAPSGLTSSQRPPAADTDDSKATEITLAEVPSGQDVNSLIRQPERGLSERGPPAADTASDQPATGPSSQQQEQSNQPIDKKTENDSSQGALTGTYGEQLLRQVLRNAGYVIEPGTAIRAVAVEAAQALGRYLQARSLNAVPIEQQRLDSLKAELSNLRQNNISNTIKALGTTIDQLLSNNIKINIITGETAGRVSAAMDNDGDLERLGVFNLNDQVYMTQAVLNRLIDDRQLATIVLHEALETRGTSHDIAVEALKLLSFEHEELVAAAGLESVATEKAGKSLFDITTELSKSLDEQQSQAFTNFFQKSLLNNARLVFPATIQIEVEEKISAFVNSPNYQLMKEIVSVTLEYSENNRIVAELIRILKLHAYLQAYQKSLDKLLPTDLQFLKTFSGEILFANYIPGSLSRAGECTLNSDYDDIWLIRDEKQKPSIDQLIRLMRNEIEVSLGYPSETIIGRTFTIAKVPEVIENSITGSFQVADELSTAALLLGEAQLVEAFDKVRKGIEDNSKFQKATSDDLTGLIKDNTFIRNSLEAKDILRIYYRLMRKVSKKTENREVTLDQALNYLEKEGVIINSDKSQLLSAFQFMIGERLKNDLNQPSSSREEFQSYRDMVIAIVEKVRPIIQDVESSSPSASLGYWAGQALRNNWQAPWLTGSAVNRFGVFWGAVEALGLASLFIFELATPTLMIGVLVGLWMAHLPLMMMAGMSGQQLWRNFRAQGLIILGYGALAALGLQEWLVAWAAGHAATDYRTIMGFPANLVTRLNQLLDRVVQPPVIAGVGVLGLTLSLLATQLVTVAVAATTNVVTAGLLVGLIGLYLTRLTRTKPEIGPATKTLSSKTVENVIDYLKRFDPPQWPARMAMVVGVGVTLSSFMVLLSGTALLAGTGLWLLMAAMIIGTGLITIGLYDYVHQRRQAQRIKVMTPLNTQVESTDNQLSDVMVQLSQDQALGVVAQPLANVFLLDQLTSNIKQTRLGQWVIQTWQRPLGMRLPVLFAPYTNSPINRLLNAGWIGSFWIILTGLTGGLISSEAALAAVTMSMAAVMPGRYLSYRLGNNPAITSLAVMEHLNSQHVSEAIKALQSNYSRKNLSRLYAVLSNGFHDLTKPEDIDQLINVINTVPGVRGWPASRENVFFIVNGNRYPAQLPKAIMSSPILLYRLRALELVDQSGQRIQVTPRRRMALGGAA